MIPAGWPALLDQGIGPEFLAQRAAVDSENAGSLALVAVSVIEHGLEQRPLHLADNEVVKVAGAIAVEVSEVLLQCIFSVLVQRLALFRGFEDGCVVLFAAHVCRSRKIPASS